MPLSDAGLAIIYNKLMEVIKLLEGRTTLDTGFLSDKKSLAEWQREIHELAVDKGWWPYADAVTTPVIVEKLCLIHSEVSEALEELRQGEGPHQFISYDEDTKPIGFVIELADIMIRILDLCSALGLDIEKAIEMKHKYNKTRPYRHGGKVL